MLMNQIINQTISLISLFFLLSTLYLIEIGEVHRDWGSIVVLTLLILVFHFRTKLSWLIALSICLYGVYNVIFIGINAAEPTCMQFSTVVLRYLFKGSIDTLGATIIFWLPLVFYALILIYLLLASTRSFYLLENN